MSNRLVQNVAGLALCVVSADMALAQDTLETLRSEGSVTIAVATDPPYSQLNDDGTLGGAAPDLERAVMERLGISVIEGQFMEYGAIIPSVLSGRVDFASSLLNITPERCEAVIYATPSSCGIEALVVRNDTGATVTSYADIAEQGLIFGLNPGGEPQTTLAAEAGIPAANIVNFADYADGMKLLMDGRVDAVANNSISAQGLIDSFGDESTLRVVLLTDLIQCSAASFRPEDEALRDAYDAAFAELLADGTVEEIYTRYGLEGSLQGVGGVTADQLCAAPAE